MIKYRKRRKWKYTLEGMYSIFIGKEFPDIVFRFIEIKDGTLYIADDYAWDGPSGPTFDSKKTLRPSLIHDAIYQLMREGIISVEFKEPIDKLFFKELRNNKVWFIRARLWYRAVVVGGPTSSYVLTAP
jgi:hypothetical protein